MRISKSLFVILLFLAGSSSIAIANDADVFYEAGATPRKPPAKSLNESGPKDFYLVTIPKAGSHLAVKLLTMLTGRSGNHMFHMYNKENTMTPLDFEGMLYRFKTENKYSWHHTGCFICKKCNVIRLYSLFSDKHPEYVKIFLIRDLRDVFVSLVNFLDKTMPGVWADNGISLETPFEQKLTFCITTLLKSAIEQSIYWLHDPEVIRIRFEDLVGPSGGGTLQCQQETIASVANALRIELTAEKLQNITDNLFGNESGPSSFTFNKGQTGRWRKYYTEEQKTLFNCLWGQYQQALGYPLAD